MTRHVFDSFAALAILRAEVGGPQARDLLRAASNTEDEVFMSVVSLGEVMYQVERADGLEAANKALGFVDQSPIQLVDANRTVSLLAARIKVETKMGYADCFVAATARILNAAIVTGDPDFAAVENSVPVEWLTASP